MTSRSFPIPPSVPVPYVVYDAFGSAPLVTTAVAVDPAAAVAGTGSLMMESRYLGEHLGDPAGRQDYLTDWSYEEVG